MSTELSIWHTQPVIIQCLRDSATLYNCSQIPYPLTVVAITIPVLAVVSIAIVPIVIVVKASKKNQQ